MYGPEYPLWDLQGWFVLPKGCHCLCCKVIGHYGNEFEYMSYSGLPLYFVLP